jgi:hypothetical protein
VIDPCRPATARAFEGATGLPYPAGISAITDLLFGGDEPADER